MKENFRTKGLDKSENIASKNKSITISLHDKILESLSEKNVSALGFLGCWSAEIFVELCDLTAGKFIQRIKLGHKCFWHADWVFHTLN